MPDRRRAESDTDCYSNPNISGWFKERTSSMWNFVQESIFCACVWKQIKVMHAHELIRGSWNVRLNMARPFHSFPNGTERHLSIE